MRRLGVVLLAAVLGGSGLAAPARAAAPGAVAPGAVTPGFVESTVDNPVTALPPVSRPPTRHCTVPVMHHVFGNSYGAPFTGTLTPPAGCRGPWSKVVLDFTASVAGRQYDRLINVYIGDTEVFRSSTQEPTPAGISWRVATDITEFVPLLGTAQPVTVDLDNIVNETYTGSYDTTMSVTYYQTGPGYPAARTADDVVTLAAATPTNDGAYTLNAGGTATATVTLPRDIVGARMELYARGGGCDEQWFSAVPNDLAARYPSYLCGGGPYREVEVTVDGYPAGVTQVYPVVYTGGIVPTLWRPIPAIDAFVTRPYDLDLTPFAALLSNGKPHTVTLTPYGDNDYWLVDATLFLDESPTHTPTRGALTADTLAIAPAVHTTEVDNPDGSTTVDVDVARDWVVSGYIETPHGRATTTVTTTSRYHNTDRVSDAGAHQRIRQRDTGTVTVAGTGRPTRTDTWSYPIDVDATIVSYVDGNNYDLEATVNQQRHLSTRERGRPEVRVDDSLTATGVLARTGGTVTEADGTASEHYTGTDDTGRRYDHLIVAEHGVVVRDRVR